MATKKAAGCSPAGQKEQAVAEAAASWPGPHGCGCTAPCEATMEPAGAASHREERPVSLLYRPASHSCSHTHPMSHTKRSRQSNAGDVLTLHFTEAAARLYRPRGQGVAAMAPSDSVTEPAGAGSHTDERPVSLLNEPRPHGCSHRTQAAGERPHRAQCNTRR